MWDTIVIGVNACGNHVRDKRNCHKRFDDIRSKLKKKIQHQRVHATGTGGGPTPQRLILSPLEELLRAKLLPVVVEGLPGDRDIGIYPSQFPPVAPEGHVSPETEQVSSPGSASSTHLEEHDEEDFDDDDDDDDAAAAIDTQIQASDHEEVPIETVLPPKRPANTTYDAIVASEGKIVEAENRRHSDLMTVLERMIALQEETVSQLAHLHRVFIEVPKQLQKINTSFEALVVQQTQANYWRMTNVPQFNTSQPGSVHAGQFSPHSSDIHSPGPNVTGQVADIAVQVPDDILPLPSVQIQQQTPTKEATKTKQDTHETDQPSLVQCLPTCSHVSVGTSPVREQSLPKSLVAVVKEERVEVQKRAEVYGPEKAEVQAVGGHSESIQLDVIHTASVDVILGLPWLQQHNPQIDWTGVLPIRWNIQCQGKCPSPSKSLAGVLLPESGNKLPEMYKEFRDVFDKGQAKELPPHHPYNCLIHVLPARCYSSQGVLLSFVSPGDQGHEAVHSRESESNYNVGIRELLINKMALEEWRHLLEGTENPITILTDHKNLLYIEGVRRLGSRQTRWSLFFTRFNFIIFYLPSSKNIKAGASSLQFLVEDKLEDHQETIRPPACILLANVFGALPDITRTQSSIP
ncbi:uncharacterized protein LOC142494679 [Ascaphus truei]|uniref:uncharacterized protein LOC142494679 n=1 Tax=Ascaphus truei TaxID=8439 RepID=UPI003F59DBDC